MAPKDPTEVGLDQTTVRPVDMVGSAHRGYRLLIIGEERHTTHRLPLSGDVSLGRSDSADMQIEDPLMSRIHARLHLGPQLTVTDLGSSNGTLVGGHKIEPHERVPISVGDTIELGSTVVILQPDFSRNGPQPHRTQANLAAPNDEGADAMHRIQNLIRRIANSQINVLLLGETGVGKEVTARSIHDASSRADRPFLCLNCASLNETLFESELFGYEKGAFTSADAAKPGLIETADGGTIFLDEVGEMPLSTQAKLLRMLEERRVMRVGSVISRAVDVRFVAATNQNLEHEAELGTFREDLFYRLNGISLVIPPLRERIGELPGLADKFVGEAFAQSGLDECPTLTPEALTWMLDYDWPGNIRELRNAINRAVLLAIGGRILPEHLQSEVFSPRTGRGSGRAAGPHVAAAVPLPGVRPSVDPQSQERERIVDALAACGGNQTRAAKMLGIARRTLTTRLDRLNIPRPRKDRR